MRFTLEFRITKGAKFFDASEVLALASERLRNDATLLMEGDSLNVYDANRHVIGEWKVVAA